ncbi:MAG: redoxin domain-containing protein [Spirochaetaceae bacterium]|nr:MAG: redoxin domain-containing protein [Spirochaetaceae bacterium]
MKLRIFGALALIVAGAVFLGCQSPSRSEASELPVAVGETDDQTSPEGVSPTDGGKASEADSDGTEERKSWAGIQPAPEFPAGLEWLNTEQPLTLSELKGKVVILDFWTYGCINCIHNLPWLKKLQQEFPQELVILGIHSAKFIQEGQTENIRNIILRYDLDHPIVNDNQFQVFNMWGARAWPTLVIIDPVGNIVGGMSGEGFYPVFKPVIESLIAEFDSRGMLDRSALNLKREKEGLPETVLSFPGKVLADGQRKRLFISDTSHHRIVIAHMENGSVLDVIGSGREGFSDGHFAGAEFNDPQGLALSGDGNTLYVADTDNHAVRRVDLIAREVATLAGLGSQATSYPPDPGIAPQVALSSPWDLELEGSGLYIAMAGSHQLWRMDLYSGETRALAGSGIEGFSDGPLDQAELAQPSGLSLDRESRRLYFADSEGSTIRWADLGSGTVGTLAGSGKSLFEFGDRDGTGNQALLQHPLGVVVHRGQVYVADTYNSKIKVADPQSREIRTLVGGQTGWRDGADPLFYEPGGIDAYGDRLYVADTNNHSVRVIDLATGSASTLVLKGAKELSLSIGPKSSGESGSETATVRLEPVQLTAGDGLIRLEVRLPVGYKVNDTAPSVFEWEVQGRVAVLPADATRSVVEPSFPLELEVEFLEGSGELALNMFLIYCEAEQDQVCLIERVRFEAPIRVKTGVGVDPPAGLSANAVVFHHQVDLPEL